MSPFELFQFEGRVGASVCHQQWTCQYAVLLSYKTPSFTHTPAPLCSSHVFLIQWSVFLKYFCFMVMMHLHEASKYMFKVYVYQFFRFSSWSFNLFTPVHLLQITIKPISLLRSFAGCGNKNSIMGFSRDNCVSRKNLGLLIIGGGDFFGKNHSY